MKEKPPASLTSVKLRRGPRPIKDGKAGDITAALQGTAPMPMPPPVAATPVQGVLPLLPQETIVERAPLESPDAIIETRAAVDEAAEFRRVPTEPLPLAATGLLPEDDVVITAGPAADQPHEQASESAAQSQAAKDRPRYWDFVDYWDKLRHGYRMPTLSMLDRSLVAECWPDSLIVSYPENNEAMPQIARLSRATGEIEYTPLVTDWIISCARETVRYGEAMEDEQEFPYSRGMAGYRLLLLPFATDEGKGEFVLCHLCRAENPALARI